MTLYHGTSNEAAESIKRQGILRGPVYMTPERELAESYIFEWESTGVVIELDVPVDMLRTDMECLNDDPGVESASSVFCPVAVAAEYITAYHFVEEN